MLSVQPGPGAELLRIGRGERLALDVAKHCRQLAINAQFDPDAVELARQIVTLSSRRDLADYARIIRASLGWCFLYTNDPRDAEALKSCGDMARDIFGPDGVTRGDCDEAAALGAGLALCVGFEHVNLVLEKHWRADQPYEHIFAEVMDDSGTWTDFDTTRHPGMMGVPIAGYLRCEV